MLIDIFVNFGPIIIAILFHELAHGYMAYFLGDDTAKRYGRLSLNPIRHVDVFGTILLPLLLIFSQSGIIIGWAKPVPIDFQRLKHRSRDTVLVASAGIITNIILAMISASLLRLVPHISNQVAQGITGLFLLNLVAFNIVLAIFNALPIPPLDGSKILFGWSKNPTIQKILDSDRQGMFIIIFLIFLLPLLAQYMGYNFNPFSSYLIGSSKYFLSLLL